jgi:hypothetical protein
VFDLGIPLFSSALVLLLVLKRLVMTLSSSFSDVFKVRLTNLSRTRFISKKEISVNSSLWLREISENIWH